MFNKNNILTQTILYIVPKCLVPKHIYFAIFMPIFHFQNHAGRFLLIFILKRLFIIELFRIIVSIYRNYVIYLSFQNENHNHFTAIYSTDIHAP